LSTGDNKDCKLSAHLLGQPSQRSKDNKNIQYSQPVGYREGRYRLTPTPQIWTHDLGHEATTMPSHQGSSQINTHNQ